MQIMTTYMRKTIVGLGVALFLSSVAIAHSAPITMTVVNETQTGFSSSWIHAASSCSGNGFCMNGDAERFTPMSFSGDWDGTRLTIGSSTGGAIQGNISGTAIQSGDVLSYTGGVIERNTDSSAQGFVQYEITRGAGLIDSGMFFIFPDLTLAGSSNSFTSTNPVVDITTWSNNWINGKGRDWTFLNGLDNGFNVTFDGTNTNGATFNGSALGLTIDGSQPGGNFTHLGMDLVAEGMAPVPEPGTMILFGTGLLGLIGYRRIKTRT